MLPEHIAKGIAYAGVSSPEALRGLGARIAVEELAAVVAESARARADSWNCNRTPFIAVKHIYSCVVYIVDNLLRL